MKFSITIPAYKRKYLRECIESVLAQTYKDFELIIVDDASPEDIGSVVASFSDARIRYYKNEKNCGAVNLADNWNICLSYARGEYIICMGDDDRLLPCCLAEYDKLITAYPGLGVYHAWTQIIDERSNVTRMQAARPLRESVYSMMWHRRHGRAQYIGDFLFDVKRLRADGGFFKMPLAWGSDDITAYIAARQTGIANMQVPGFQYRVNAQTISRTGNISIKIEAVDKEESWYDNFLSAEPDRQKDETAYIFWRMMREEITKDMMKKRLYLVSGDIAGNGIVRLLYWLRHRKAARLSRAALAYAAIEAVKHNLAKGI